MININKETIYKDLIKKITKIQSNKLITEISIKDILINNEQDIEKGLEKCIHDKYSDVDIVIKAKDDLKIQLKGTGIVKDEDGEYEYNLGDVFMYPANVFHEIFNNGTIESEYIFVRVHNDK